MPISLNKGGNVSLSKEDPGLTKVVVGLGWDVCATSGANYDLDASDFVLIEDTGRGIVRYDLSEEPPPRRRCCSARCTGAGTSRSSRPSVRASRGAWGRWPVTSA